MRWIALLLLMVGFAGCSDVPTETAADDSFDDVELEVTDKTGGIRGVVVDDRIVPVEGVVVTLLSQAESQTTDDQGRFSFGDLEPGTYFLTAGKDLYEEIQLSADVVAGVAEPAILKVQLNRLFKADPYIQTIANSGFFTCSQGNTPGYLYSSSSCHSQGVLDLDDYGIELDQERDFHADVEAGWQNLVWEMTWEPSAQGTSPEMGIVVSTYKPERAGAHWFEDHASTSPMRFQLDVGVPGLDVGSVDPKMIPVDGLPQMSYFMSVRPPSDATCVLWCVPPGVALDQSFEVWLTQFYYAPAPEGWSFVKGDQNPF